MWLGTGVGETRKGSRKDTQKFAYTNSPAGRRPSIKTCKSSFKEYLLSTSYILGIDAGTGVNQ